MVEFGVGNAAPSGGGECAGGANGDAQGRAHTQTGSDTAPSVRRVPLCAPTHTHAPLRT